MSPVLGDGDSTGGHEAGFIQRVSVPSEDKATGF